MQKFSLNGKEYKLPELNFKALLSLEEKGCSFTDAEKKPMKFLVGILSLAVGDTDVTATEIERHIVSGGSLEDIMNVVKEAVEESGFFQALSQKKEETKAK